MQWTMLLMLSWTVLALVWLGELLRQSSKTGWYYPLLPLAVGLAYWLKPELPVLPEWLAAGLFLWGALTLVWLISLVKRDASIMDIAYGLLLTALPWWAWQHSGANPQALPLLLLSSIGFGRYSLYILWRNLPHGEDARYARWRQRSGRKWWWWSYFQVFLLQAVVMWIWAYPLVVAVTQPQPLGGWAIAGAVVWLIGFVFEAVGDWQLARFKRRRSSSAQLLDTGLWGLTRHPNYFGQAAMWCGYGLVAMASPYGWLSVLPIAYVVWFMYTGSATSLMERHMQKTKPGYADYCKRTPAFFPRIKS
ncbi:DUF1295 domain-containing protein [Lampropedia aestuarii]|uniref:DUF1295 domain-containing protein n=1 Tax=Lampropedia aestuarii TaxID=2562762 RepID=UPI0024688C47|nr:DUF1295 domain-containing protein [Lampropedia aestuarii]MDH5858452.1 DUF1295 domain-containing protein [Lampropedia aestuarii]